MRTKHQQAKAWSIAPPADFAITKAEPSGGLMNFSQYREWAKWSILLGIHPGPPDGSVSAESLHPPSR